MASRGVVLFAAMLGGAAALATAKPADTAAICGIVCVDKVNECGEKYGGCYDPCLEAAPEEPPCTIPGTHIWYPTPPPSEVIPFTEGEDGDCSDIIVCIDGVNECGIPFGACIPDCKPWDITIPSCPPDATEPTETDGGNATDGGDGSDGGDETNEPVEAVPWQGAELPVPEEPVVGEPVPGEPLIGEPVPDEIVPWDPSGSRGWP
ncbi:hypothetical protein V8C44DRAFT_326788 [Trichoderma aethiopicum]